MELSTLETADHVNCAQCGNDDIDVIFDKGVAQISRVVRCRRCNLMYANPREQLVDHADYERYEPIGLLDGVESDKQHAYRWRFDKEAGQVRDFDHTAQLLRRLHPDRGHVVEVGSGLGFLLKSFKDDGWKVTGVDPWREVASFTESFHGFETVTTTLEQARFPDESADVVVILHVIEHVPAPLGTLREIFRILRPGGHLVLETPRYDTLMFKLMGRRERSIRQDGHIYFFTTETLKNAYEAAGFQEVDTRFVGRTLTGERLLWNAANIMRSERISDATAKLSHGLGLQRLTLSMNLRDMQRVVVKKPQEAVSH